MLKNDIFIRAAKGEAVERTPVWLMRQAGRILPQYRKVRENVGGFKELVKDPELICEVTIQPVDELDVDAAIIFSDILVIPEAMGCDYEMIEAKGPKFPNTVRSREDLKNIKIADVEDLNYVIKAIELTKRELNNRVPLIGFAGAPWTIFAYMAEGSGSKTFSHAKRILYQDPEFAHTFLDMITQSTIKYLKAQVAAGANLIQIFDSWAGILSPEQFSEFSLRYISQICNAIKDVPVTVFAKDAAGSRYALATLDCEVIGLDWTMDIKESREIIGNDKILQGNLDPCVLYADKEVIRSETVKMLKRFGPTHHIANLGHGVYPDTPLDGVKYFIDTVKNYKH